MVDQKYSRHFRHPRRAERIFQKSMAQLHLNCMVSPGGSNILLYAQRHQNIPEIQVFSCHAPLAHKTKTIAYENLEFFLWAYLFLFCIHLISSFCPRVRFFIFIHQHLYFIIPEKKKNNVVFFYSYLHHVCFLKQMSRIFANPYLSLKRNKMKK